MADDRGLAIFSGIAQGVERATTNLFNISVAKEKLKRDREQSDLGFKIKKLQIKKAEHELSPEQVKFENEKLKAETQAKKSAYNLSEIKIDTARQKNERDKQESEQALDFLDTMERGTADPDTKWKYKIGNLTLSGGGEEKVNTVTQAELKNLSTAIEQGKITTQKDLQLLAEKNRDALQMKGVDVDYLISEGQRILPESVDRAGKWERFTGKQKYDRRVKDGKLEEQREDKKWYSVPVELPETIRTSSEAIEYLKDTYKMTDEEAKDWLRSANKKE